MHSNSYSSDRKFDVVVVGASGFTGQLVVEYLASNYPVNAPLRWAIAGRNPHKLKSIASRIFDDATPPAILTADSHDDASLRSLAGQTRVVLTTVGPYARYGSKLLAACVESGTHYCDLAGEPQWTRKMIDQHQGAAVTSGARIVPSCGFDSIPSDIGVWFLQREANARYGTVCREIQTLVRAIKGGASGGTYASMINVLEELEHDRELARILANPYSLNPTGERSGPDGSDQRSVRYAATGMTWTAPFVMAAINTRIVRRTNALLGYRYGRDFRYTEASAMGPGIRGWSKAAGLTAGLGLFMLGCSIGLTRRTIIKKIIPAPGAGPSPAERENGYFKLELIGTTASGKQIRARVNGDRDPGYGSTCKMLAESAICLATDPLEVAGGFWTPASAMAEPLLARLESNAGLTFESVV